MNITKQIKPMLNRLNSLIKDSETVVFDFYDFEITKREIISSIGIIAIMMLIGSVISTNIKNNIEDKRREYTQALQIDSQEMFEYGMKTNVGNAYVYGELSAVDIVSYPDIEGEYMYVEKVTEEYTRHTRTVKSGKTYRTEVYYTWDVIDSEDKHSENVTFLNVQFDYEKFAEFDDAYIDTVYKGYHNIRYVYYGVPKTMVGTIYTELSDNTITDKTVFREDTTIEEAYEFDCKGYGLVIFWIAWILFMGLCVFGFYYLPNRWLE